MFLKLALRAGNEKEEGETADTVGCCSLRVEHITLHEQMDGKEYVVEFDFLGKDSIRYYNKVPVSKKVKQLEINCSNSFQSNQICWYQEMFRLDLQKLSLFEGDLIQTRLLIAKPIYFLIIMM